MLKEVLGMVSWAVQLLLAAAAPVIALVALEIALNTQDTLAPQLFGYVFLAVAGTGLAFAVSALNHGWVEVGVWVWTLPTIMEIWAIISAGYSTGGLTAVGHLFLVPGPGGGEEGLGAVFITFPTWSCCWYSVALWWRLRQRRQSAA
jgi:hypothetical protein